MPQSKAKSTSPATADGRIPIVLCADDYGLAPGVGRAIRDLLARGRLSATSCMTVSAFWPDEGAALRPFAQRADIGLHLTLTDQRPLGPMPRLAPSGRLPSIARLIVLAYTRQLPREEVAAELTRQIDRFEAVFGHPPAYLDGHQHAHQLPVIRDVVIELFQHRLASHGGYLRYCVEPLGSILTRRLFIGESLIISLLGRRLAQRGRRAGIPGNRRFRGVHDFSGRRPYAQLFAAFLENAEPGTLIMCHPGLSDAALAAADPVTSAREEEYRYFLSDEFAATIDKTAVLSRFPAAAHLQRQ
ncbi:MAG TPA: ChbG/HpnK family deacetylase [Alphaproteobacteria bacterium]|nr:ChbG/HpnK family deacetylase [Alphaproteobacteria bacterium]